MCPGQELAGWHPHDRPPGPPRRPRPARGGQGVASVACHGGIGALPWLRVYGSKPGARACAYHRLEPARQQTALYRIGVCWLPGPGPPAAPEETRPMSRTRDTRITGYEPLLSPAALLYELPLSDE